ncbi:hypothetical protein EYF80_059408 [Liparis tanakae]|uniref:Uncharacterized protein n=1 Tax=Liparis tanakae TaxID=230148 RepID=A0A4Z2EPG4_9TELE|nr:hypothetical protein EYF80_059408 [Liparis tanakae]
MGLMHPSGKVVRHHEHLQFGLLASDHLLARQLLELKLLYGGGGSGGSLRRPARVAAVVGVAALTPAVAAAAAVVVGLLLRLLLPLLFLNLLLPRRPEPPGRLSSVLLGLLSVCLPLATDVRFVRGRGRGHVASLVQEAPGGSGAAGGQTDGHRQTGLRYERQTQASYVVPSPIRTAFGRCGRCRRNGGLRSRLRFARLRSTPAAIGIPNGQRGQVFDGVSGVGRQLLAFSSYDRRTNPYAFRRVRQLPGALADGRREAHSAEHRLG